MRGWKFLILACVLLMPTVALAQETKLLDFYADWCGPCKAMTPVVEQLAAEGYQVQRVNVDANRELAAQYGVQNIPCFVVVEDGRELNRITGPTTIERLKVKLQRKPAVKVEAAGQPHAAWRYERPGGYRQAVVRIYCREDGRTRSIGSGVLVRWGERVVVLTARHVVKDAREIIVELCTKKTYYGHVLKVDATWDCAVLQLTGTPEGVVPAEVELGQAAMPADGVRLESCGYGSDNKLAANTGLFKGYRRSSDAKDGPDDWMVISGHARPGDSGGPVFNGRGHVVGVLWGTDGEEVICVQPGRLHVLLTEAVKVYVPRATGDGWHAAPMEGVQTQFQRRPTPPMPGPEPYVAPQAGCDCPPGTSCDQTAGTSGGYLLPYRTEEARKQAAANQQLQDISNTLRQIQGRMEANAAAPPQVVLPPTPTPPAVEEKKPETLKEKIDDKKAEVKEKVDALLESPIARHFAVFLGLVVVIFLLHAVYKFVHGHLPAIVAKLSSIPVVGTGLATGLTAQDAFNTAKIEPLFDKLQAATDKAKADLTSHVAALNTPAPGQASAPTATPAPVSVNVTTPTK